MSRSLALAFPILLALVACNGGDEEGGGPTDPTDPTGAGDVVTVDIVAADGGTVAVGAATLDIPPGALAADTTITASSTDPDASLPELDSVVGQVYDFGPDGTTFDPAATLTLPLPVTPGTGEVAVVSWLDPATDAWVDLPTTAAGGSVTAPVEHFTTFVVRIVIGGDGDPGECVFDGGCGGDLVGTWTIDSFCLNLELTEGGLPPCVELRIDGDMTGTVTFAGDGTYTADTRLTGQIVAIYSGMCLAGATDCAQLDDPEEGFSCTGDVGTECTCVSALDETSADVGTWQSSGSSLLMDEQEEAGVPEYGPTESEYCVSGSDLQLLDLEGGTVVRAHR